MCLIRYGINTFAVCISYYLIVTLLHCLLLVWS